jgi:hypothetical protein
MRIEKEVFKLLLTALSISYFILHGSVVKSSQVRKMGVGKVPLLYKSIIVEFLLNISIIFYLGLGVYLLFFYSWKVFIILFISGALLANLIIIPIIERIFYYPIYRITKDFR